MTPEQIAFLTNASPAVLYLAGLVWVVRQWQADRSKWDAANEARHRELLDLVREYHEASKATVLTLERITERLNDVDKP